MKELTFFVFVEKSIEILQQISLEFSKARVCMNSAHVIALSFSLTILTSDDSHPRMPPRECQLGGRVWDKAAVCLRALAMSFRVDLDKHRQQQVPGNLTYFVYPC